MVLMKASIDRELVSRFIQHTVLENREAAEQAKLVEIFEGITRADEGRSRSDSAEDVDVAVPEPPLDADGGTDEDGCEWCAGDGSGCLYCDKA